jgi:hypothetical protein
MARTRSKVCCGERIEKVRLAIVAVAPEPWAMGKELMGETAAGVPLPAAAILPSADTA